MIRPLMDDMLNVGHDAKKIQSLKGELSMYFKMKNLKLKKTNYLHDD